MLETSKQPLYAVKVFGKIISKPFQNSVLAEEFIQRMSEDQRNTAIVVPVSTTGNEILLG